jgi:hypothetical protein
VLHSCGVSTAEKSVYSKEIQKIAVVVSSSCISCSLSVDFGRRFYKRDITTLQKLSFLNAERNRAVDL